MKFVSKYLALKLKEKGFDRPCFGWYFIDTPIGHTDGVLILNTSQTGGVAYEDLLYSNNQNTNSYYSNCVDAPTIEQVLKWLREEKEISIEVGIHHSFKWICGIYKFNGYGIDDFSNLTQYDDRIDGTVPILYPPYEQAALTGIEYVLNNNLI